jgi:hypothetical protein
MNITEASFNTSTTRNISSMLEIYDNDFIHKSGEVLFSFQKDDAEVDDIFKFVTMPISEYKNIIIMREITAYSYEENKKVIIRKGHKFSLAREITRGPKRGLFFNSKGKVYYLPADKY